MSDHLLSHYDDLPRFETDYRVVYDDPDRMDEPTKVLYPAPEWMHIAMTEGFCSIDIWWEIEDAETKAKDEGWHESFRHTDEILDRQHERHTGPMTEEEAIVYLCLKDLPRKCWDREHNRPMFKIVKKDQVPTERTFRNAWEMEY